PISSIASSTYDVLGKPETMVSKLSRACLSLPSFLYVRPSSSRRRACSSGAVCAAAREGMRARARAGSSRLRRVTGLFLSPRDVGGDAAGHLDRLLAMGAVRPLEADLVLSHGDGAIEDRGIFDEG